MMIDDLKHCSVQTRRQRSRIAYDKLYQTTTDDCASLGLDTNCVA